MTGLTAFIFLAFLGSQCLAQVSVPQSVTVASLKNDYKNKALRVLIVPGHDSEDVGTDFNGVKEADLNLKLAQKILKAFEKDQRFQVFISRNDYGYVPTLKNYLEEQRDAIKIFREEIKRIFSQNYINFEKKEGIIHNGVSEKTANKLYGINKWANDYNIDIVLHVHFNDDAERWHYRKGEYSGFSIYIPEKQLPNSEPSRILADSIFNNLKTILAVSNLPQESAGVVEDQELIAIGAKASLSAASLLVEYGYIYETHFLRKPVNDYLLNEMAYLTYAGLAKYFNPEIKPNKYDSAILPYVWRNKLTEGMKNKEDVLALQIALIKDGSYPPASFDLRSCPITGSFLDCTEKAVKSFQKKNGLTEEKGLVGILTLKKLNSLYKN